MPTESCHTTVRDPEDAVVESSIPMAQIYRMHAHQPSFWCVGQSPWSEKLSVDDVDQVCLPPVCSMSKGIQVPHRADTYKPVSRAYNQFFFWLATSEDPWVKAWRDHSYVRQKSSELQHSALVAVSSAVHRWYYKVTHYSNPACYWRKLELASPEHGEAGAS